MSQITTTGDLRKYLTNMMIGVRDGTLAIDKAAQITKLASQVNESFYAEVKIAQVRKASGHVVDDLGKLPIGEPE